jgi:F-type H+-transporting ATPase subunit gamma
MSERRAIERRLTTLGDVAEIMNALKNMAMVEAVRLRRQVSAQQRVVYTMELAVQDFLTHYPQPLPAESRGEGIVLVVGSERGFCGSYNEELARVLEREHARRTQSRIVVIGRRLAARLSPDVHPSAVLGAPSVAEEVSSVLARLAALLQEVAATRDQLPPLLMTVLYHEVAGRASEVQTQQVFRAFGVKQRRFANPPMLYLDPDAFFRELAEEYLFAVLHRVFYSALLAENERRMQHLEGALRRVDRIREELARRNTALRQEEITEEIEVILLSSGIESSS